MYHPFSIAMQCMWRTKVSSGTISATTADSCDIPYHYQGVSFGKRAAGWSETVLWSAGTVRRWCLFTPVWLSSATANKLCPATRHEDSSPWRRPRSLRYVRLFWVETPWSKDELDICELSWTCFILLRLLWRQSENNPAIWLWLTLFLRRFNDLITHCMENNPSLYLTTTSLQNPKLFP